MKYIMILCMMCAIIILFGSVLNYLKIKKHLHAEVYYSDKKYNVISNLYAVLMAFFLIAYIVFLAFLLGHPSFDRIVCVAFALLLGGSVFVGLSVLVLKQSLAAVLEVKQNELDSMTGLMTKNSFEMSTQRILNEG